jgi:hypothetical protein
VIIGVVDEAIVEVTVAVETGDVVIEVAVVVTGVI